MCHLSIRPNSVTDGGYTRSFVVIHYRPSRTQFQQLVPMMDLAGVPFGTSAGEFNQICVTTAGHMIFMETIHLIVHQMQLHLVQVVTWQGFAIGANAQGGDYNDDGMLWQIRNIEPDPDNNAPVVTGGEIGDSHALKEL